MVWYDMICDMIWYDMIWYDMIWYDMIWYDMSAGSNVQPLHMFTFFHKYRDIWNN
jgi:hypothetical protein